MLKLLPIIPLLSPGIPLLTPPEPTESVASEDPPPPSPEKLDYGTSLALLAKADEDANVDPIGTTGRLAAALDAMAEFGPSLAADPSSLELRQLARLNLARAYQISGEPLRAAAAMDEAIREALGANLPAADFGPRLEQLYNERLAALVELGRATLEVHCELPCKVYVNEREVATGPQKLLLGTYRVWIDSPTNARAELRQTVELAEPNSTVKLDFGPEFTPPPPPPPPPKKPPRIMPVEAEVPLILVGIVLSTVGSVLVGTGYADESPARLGGGIATLVVGLGALTTGAVALGIDERRINRDAGKQVVVSWTMQF